MLALHREQPVRYREFGAASERAPRLLDQRPKPVDARALERHLRLLGSCPQRELVADLTAEQSMSSDSGSRRVGLASKGIFP